ncbi:epoxyqueuosine reductase [Limnochorda pilosa]|uniref:Epoxyqueuosine reductase n=1 Tax=Limnochorda pilosa TaxID=1555112 RepID=A0A0K2SJ27_LIMPI|nr:tRNA epoxyqueuosine(34) reductase QueG [Limnochorda pilosa]BAS27032.1 epoxyqueuosine reductase [Limnochorda pilosa]
MSLEEELKAEGRRLGFHRVGIAPASELARARALLQSQAEQGTYPAFTHPDAALRTDPSRWLEGARSVVAVALAYPHPPRSAPSDGSPRGLVARYACFEDYHPVIEEGLRKLMALLARRAGRPVRWRLLVDTGPAVDRAVAEKAGLGGVGKNGCLFVNGAGSWVVLGEAVTDVALTPDEPVSLDCGTCNRCVEACPTGALEPYRVDPRLCISEATQLRGPLPGERRESLGRYVWGCDICQQVCPWNRDVDPEGALLDPLPQVGPNPSLLELLTLTRQGFRERFAHSALNWRDEKVLQRNAAYALGNLRRASTVPALAERLVADPSPTVRGAAAWALGRIATARAVEALAAALVTECDRGVRRELEDALRVARSSPSPPSKPRRHPARAPGRRGSESPPRPAPAPPGSRC